MGAGRGRFGRFTERIQSMFRLWLCAKKDRPLSLYLLLVILGRPNSGLLVHDLSSIKESWPRLLLLWAGTGALLVLI